MAIDLGNPSADAQQRDPNAPPLPLRWTAVWYVEWNEWMIGVKAHRVGGFAARIKLGPFGVTVFRTIDWRRAS